MKIKRLTLKNFKGIGNLSIYLDGKNAKIFGNNATGKTTVLDSVLWLLFDKDSSGVKDFEIKTLDTDGKAIPMIDHTVEAEVIVHGSTQTLRKTFKEKYTKKRGSTTADFTGHETEYQINGVPKSKGEYQVFIESFAPEKLFRLLTSPTFFSTGMKWQERRQIILEICMNVSDEDVIAANPALAPLAELLKIHSIDDAKKVEAAARKKINDELQSIPARVDEAQKAIPDISGNPEQLMIKARKAAGELEQLRAEKAQIVNGGAVVQMRKKMAEIDTAIIELKNKHTAAAGEAGKEDREKLRIIEGKMHSLAGLIDRLNRLIVSENDNLERLIADNKTIVAAWKSENAKLFVRGGACQTCGQDYPETLLDVQEADFNRAKSQEIERISKDGSRNAFEVNKSRALIEGHHQTIAEAEQEKSSLEAQARALQATIASKEQAPDITESPEHKELEAQRATIKESLIVAENATVADTTTIDAKIASKSEELNGINASITALETASVQEKRIEELKAREKELAKQYEQSERTLFLIETLIRDKVSMLESSINSKFSPVSFKLFDEQINGGLSETCVCTMGGVPYSDLNTAAKIQAGLTIINTLSSHYEFFPVCFIDGRESITSIPEMECQVVSLIVSESDKELRVELQ